MPNWKKVIVSGSDASLNSLNVTTYISASSFNGSHTGSLLGTASYASNALTASYVANASSFPYTGSAIITGSLGVTGSVSITGSGTILSANVDTIVFTGSLSSSGSVNINGPITGSSFTGSYTGSLFGTASYATTASYAMNGGSGGGLSALYIQDEGVTQGTASYINFTGTGVTATVTAGTASISITGGGGTSTGQSVLFTQASPATTWTFSHNLNNQYVTYNVYDNNSNAIIPANVSASNANTLIITFGVATAGYAVATVGGGLPFISGSFNGYVLTVSGSVATWTPTSSISVLSASYASTATSASYSLVATSASYASASTSASYASSSTSASFASNAAQAQTASYVVTAQTASFVTLAQTASFVTTAQTASFVATASYANNADLLDGLNSTIFATTGSNTFNGTQTITGSILQSGSFTSTGTITAQTLVVQTVSSSVVYSSGSNIFGNNIANTQTLTGSVRITGSLTLVGNEIITGSSTATLGYTGSLLGTASRADNATSASYAATATSASYSLVATSASYASASTSASYASFAASGTGSFSGSFNGVVTGSLLGTSSYASNALTASYSLVATSASYAANATTSSYALTTTSASYALNATSASYVNTLNQNIIVTGSLTVGATSVGSNENTLTLGPAPGGGAGEGGQLLLQASGGLYTSASMLDNWQNQTRLLRGTNAGSDAVIASFNMNNGQIVFSKYTGSGAFSGTATANLSVDSGGNIITTAIGSSLTGGSTNYIARWSSSTTLTTGSLFDNGTNVGIGTTTASYKLDVSGDIRATGAVYANANGTMYFRGGDDAELWDINVANTVGVYGQQDQTVGSIKLGSGGGTISGYSGNIGIGTTTASLGKLHVNGNVYATSFTGSFTGSLVGSLTGTSSFATSASYAFQSTSASYAANSTTASYALTSTSASYASTSTSGSYAATASVASTTFGIGATIQTYGSVASSIVGSNNLFSQNTGSYTSAFFKYTATSGSNTRAGEVISVWNGTTTSYTDFSTVDIGNTNNVTASISIVTGQVQFNVQTNSSGWAIKSIATFM